MKTGPKEAEFRNIFKELGETGQDRLLDVARALFFAAKTCYPEGGPANAGEPERGESEPNNPGRATAGLMKRRV
jgi:hypothetical protein